MQIKLKVSLAFKVLTANVNIIPGITEQFVMTSVMTLVITDVHLAVFGHLFNTQQWSFVHQQLFQVLLQLCPSLLSAGKN